MKSVNEVREMLKEAKEKYAAAVIEYKEARTTFSENVAMRIINEAEIEIKCFTSVLGGDAIGAK